MALTYYAGWDFARIGSFSLEFTTDEPGTFTATISSGTYAHVDMQTLTGTGNYDDFATILKTTMDATASARTFTVTLNANHTYTITPDTGTLLFTASTNTVATRILGFTAADLPTVAAASVTSTVRPWYIIEPYISARSNVTDDYEGGEIAYDGEADDGNSYGISRTTAPLYHDWTQGFEPKAATFKNSASADEPFTYQHMFEHCRNIEPIYVIDSLGGSGTDNMAVRLRADGAVWRPQRVSADFDDQWNIPFNTRVIVTSAGVSRA